MIILVLEQKIFCPACGAIHVDSGEWEKRAHSVHLCLFCKVEFRVVVKGIPSL